MLEHTIDALVEANVLGESHFGTLGRLVLGARVVRRAEVRFEERNARAVLDVHGAARALALSARGRRKADDADRAGLGEEFRYFRHSPHVFFALRTGDAEIGAEAGP